MSDNQTKSHTVSETIARALISAGVKVVTCVPGSGVNEVFADYNRASPKPAPVSFHEEAAYSLALGAALTGTRAACLVKSHGMVKAGNSVSDSLYSGTTAGLVTIVFEDKTGKQSDSILDIRSFLDGIGLSYQVSQKENLSGQIYQLFARSEKDGLPQALVVESSEVLDSVSTGSPIEPVADSPQYRRDITQHILCPFFADYQNQVLQGKRSGTGWRNIPKPGLPRIPESVPAKWQGLIASYAGLFQVFKSIRGSVVTGDTGVSSLFACEPFNCIDITTYLGGSVPLAAGAHLGGCRDAWAVTGDFSFIGAGHLGLLEAWQRGIPLKVLILYNGRAETTGGQIIPENTLETVLSGYSQYIRYIRHPGNNQETADTLGQAAQSRELSIVIADYR
jgi:TPP-dependent indolepyruvate ferredoxin oxidoreductase alpha subunit